MSNHSLQPNRIAHPPRIGVTTPCYYPPWFKSYKAFRAHINALVARREAAIHQNVDGAK